jgi:hypothetical protein
MSPSVRCAGGQVEHGRVWAGIHFDGAGRPNDVYRDITITQQTCGWNGPSHGRKTCPDCGGQVTLIPEVERDGGEP